MPEGPDVWYLAKLINRIHPTVHSYGKHIYVANATATFTDYSFGLTGKLAAEMVESKLVISKNSCGYLPGDITTVPTIGHGLGVSFMDMKLEDFKKIVEERFVKSRAMLGTIMLNQKIIAGIGIAWGSEILHLAGVLPNIKACNQDLSKLADAMYQIKTSCMEQFGRIADNVPAGELIEVINMFNYRILPMKVYKIGNQCPVGGRIWWTAF